MKFKSTCIIMIYLTVLINGCNKEDTFEDNMETAAKLLTVLIVQNGAADIYAETLAATQDSIAAVNAVGQWLLDQSDVQEAYIWGSDLVEVRFKNGMKSNLVADTHDAEGQSRTRGGSGGGKFANFSQITDLIEISNKKVLVLNAFEESMYHGAWNKKSLFAPTIKNEDIDVFNDDEVTISRLSTLGNYGLIILNTHGVPNGFFIKQRLELESGITHLTLEEVFDLIVNQMNLPIEKFENGELQWDAQVQLDGYWLSHKWALVNVTDKWVRNAPFTLDQAVVFGNHCYSGYNLDASHGDLPGAWKSKGAVTYYGYAFSNHSSGAVWNHKANEWEDSLITNLARGDSTGIAHLANNATPQFHLVSGNAQLPVLVTRGLNFGTSLPPPSTPIPLFFTQFDKPNYTYDACRDSVIDGRDQQWYKTVCIGNQTWMAENLNFASANSKCFLNDPNICRQFGRLYSRTGLFGTDEPVSRYDSIGVRGVCPEGWHIASHQEWMKLELAFGMPLANLDAISYPDAFTRGRLEHVGDKLKSNQNWSTPANSFTNESGLLIVPAGWGSGPDSFFGTGLNGRYWTSSYGDNTPDLVNLIVRQFEDSHGGVDIGRWPVVAGNEESVYFSCRCVKD